MLPATAEPCGTRAVGHCHEMPQKQVLKEGQLGPGVSVSHFAAPARACNSIGRLYLHTVGLRLLSMVDGDLDEDQSPRRGHWPGTALPTLAPAAIAAVAGGWVGSTRVRQRWEGMVTGPRPRCGREGTTARLTGIWCFLTQPCILYLDLNKSSPWKFQISAFSL